MGKTSSNIFLYVVPIGGIFHRKFSKLHHCLNRATHFINIENCEINKYAYSLYPLRKSLLLVKLVGLKRVKKVIRFPPEKVTLICESVLACLVTNQFYLWWKGKHTDLVKNTKLKKEGFFPIAFCSHY